MPIFEYRCPICRLDFEVLELPGRSAQAQCPQCRSSQLLSKIGLFATRSGEGENDLEASDLDKTETGGSEENGEDLNEGESEDSNASLDQEGEKEGGELDFSSGSAACSTCGDAPGSCMN